MDARRSLALLALGCLLALTGPALAQQAPARLALFTPVTGTLDAGDTQAWTFSAVEGEVLSLLLEATAGDLDPALRITSSSGTALITNDDYNYPDSPNALLEAITIPRLDTYTITVSGFGSTAGSYRLTLLAGFAALAWDETFDTEAGWDSTNPQLTLTTSGGQLALQLGAAGQRAVVTPPGVELPADVYARAQVAEVTGRAGWQVGLSARQQDARSYYLFQVNNLGQWRFFVRAPLGDQIVRDWATHPAIAPGETAFTLGLMANGSGFDLFYNDLFLSHIVDDTISAAGAVGLAVETPAAADAPVIARFESVTVTTPLLVENERVIPDRVLLSRDGRVMVRDLQRRHLIPVSGEMRLTVPESFVTFNRPGVNRIALGGGQAFGELAMGATVAWDINSAAGPAGCGLIVRAASDTSYVLAYIDQIGGYGASERSDDTFKPGLFSEDPALADGSSHHLLVIASGAALRYYVNGRYAGMLDITADSGGVAVAAVNFELATTSCTFSDTWLWNWD